MVKDFRCSFCGRLRTEVSRLISGPMVFVCVDCFRACEALVADGAAAAAGGERGPRVEHLPLGPTAPPDFPARAGFADRGGVPACSFCGAIQGERRVLVHGYVTRICDACVGICRDVVEDKP